MARLFGRLKLHKYLNLCVTDFHSLQQELPPVQSTNPTFNDKASRLIFVLTKCKWQKQKQSATMYELALKKEEPAYVCVCLEGKASV